MCPKSRAEPAGKFNWSMKRRLGGRDPLQPHRPKPHTYQMTTFKSGREREREGDRERDRENFQIRFPEFTYQMKG